MTGYLFDYAGRRICEQPLRQVMEILSLTKLYGNWQHAIVTNASGKPIEMFTRL